MTSRLPALKATVLILAGAAILMAPALVVGRPFIYWDTPTFYSWGHDIVAAIRHPWPSLSAFPPHRGLWAADNIPGAWDRISAQNFQLVMTSIGARSSFYAVPLYVLGRAFNLWAIVVVQAFVTAWLLWMTVAATLPRPTMTSYLLFILALTIFTSLPYFVSFLMPDLFAGLAVLALCLLVGHYDRLTRWGRIGCSALLAIAVVVHLSIFPVVAVLLLVGMATMRIVSPTLRVRRGAYMAAAALLCAGAATVGSNVGLRSAFGEDVRPPPFLEGRVIADGPGQVFLQETCAQRHWAACLWKDVKVTNTDDIIWPDVTWHGLPLITNPDERKRFLDEQSAVVFGTLLRHPFLQLWASARNAAEQLLRFTIAYDVGGSLTGLIIVNTDRTMRVAQIVPDIKPCLTDQARACDDVAVFRYIEMVQYGVVIAAVIALIVRATFRNTHYPAVSGENGKRVTGFSFMVVSGVILNAIVCGALSGPWGRYQARVMWLLPMIAMLLFEHWRRSRGDVHTPS